jgi:MFS transporter, OFA family, oxalate/formate antiporter
LLYTAKGTAALVVPFANVAVTQFGTWDAVLIAAAFVNAVAAIMALTVLKPMRLRTLEQSATPALIAKQSTGLAA